MTKTKKTSGAKSKATKAARAAVDPQPATHNKRRATSKRPPRGTAATGAGKPTVPAYWLALWAKYLPGGYDPVAWAPVGHYFDEQAALHVIGFFPRFLHHVKGALAGQPYELADWEKAWIGCAYGWKLPDGRRQYREVFVYVPKKNDKTTQASGLTLYALTQDNELGAEIYSAAASKDQASIIFRNVAGMVRLSPELKSRLTVYGYKGGSQQRSVVYDARMSNYRPLAADEDTSDGLMPHFAVVDELHRHKNRQLLDILLRGMSSRAQPLLVTITTADYNRESACNDKLKEAKRVLKNGGDPSKPGYDPAFLPVIFEADPKSDWSDPKVWYATNPGLGISKSLEYMERACAKAKEDPIALNLFKRLDLNIQTQEVESLLSLEHWDKCPGELREEALIGRRCYGGLDLSQSNDLTAFCLAFPPEEEGGAWDFFWRLWAARDTVTKRKLAGIPFDVWEQAGWIKVCEGAALDYTAIKAKIVDDFGKFMPSVIVYDPANASDITRDLLNSYGLPMEFFRQGFLTMNAPTKRFRDYVKAGLINHGGNPAMRWQAGNVMVKQDDKDNIQPCKKKSKDKIDGIVAAIMCLGVAMVTPDEAGMIDSVGVVAI